MSRGFTDQSSENIFSIAAGAALDQTYTKYIDVRGFRRAGHQVNWTAGSGGGAVVIKCYFTMHEFIDEAQAALGDSGDVFQDNSVKLFGTATLTGDSLLTDSIGVIGCATWIKYTATISGQEAATALTMKINKCS